MSNTSEDAIGASPAHSLWLNVWAVTAAFGTYFCMYMYRKPFTAASFSSDGWQEWDQKAVLVAAQVIGYLVSKVIGIRIVAEVPRQRRGLLLFLLILASHAALFLFAIVPAPWHIVCLFLNGLPLGIVFGLVLGFLEGRRMTEALTAGLCASFILAGGVSKTVGSVILNFTQQSWLWSVPTSERWMPFLAGVVFLIPIAVFIGILSRVPPPDALDVSARSVRDTMNREERLRILRKYAGGLMAISMMYLLVTILRSLRDDFAPEILVGLGATVSSDAYATMDFWVALIVMVVNGSSVFITNNQRALQVSLGVCALGCVATLLAVALQMTTPLSPLSMMVLVGAGLYLPYVAVHTTIFERLIALTRDRANVGFLMYVADALGYCGYVVIMLIKNFLPIAVVGSPLGMTRWFLIACVVASIASLVSLVFASFQFSRYEKGSEAMPPQGAI
jgi:hypothetical protein